MNQTAVINVVGLTPDLIGEHTPFLKKWSEIGKMAVVQSMLPAVTCSVQSTYLTGVMPNKHGIVGNGWYFRDMDEIKFWRQSNKLVQAPKIWENAKQINPEFTCANLFWWYNMNSTVDYLVTPRPIYRADGIKIPDILTWPTGLREDLQSDLGQFPLFSFWGPNTNVSSSKWIAESAVYVQKNFNPTLSLIYLPHLDYNLQRIGPNDSAIAADLNEIDTVCEELISFFEQREMRVIVLSEYGIEQVSNPVSINRELRKHGYITVRKEKDGEILIPGSSRAFAVADHQIAHVYIRNTEDIPIVKKLIEELPGVEQVLDSKDMEANHLNHERSGELIAVADNTSWFTYYYWLDDSRAPDFAPTVDIHNKPGYDPAELLIDPEIHFPKLKAAMRLLQKKLGFRYTMDLIPANGNGVKGSHGRIPSSRGKNPLIISRHADKIAKETLLPTEVYDVIFSHIFG